MVRNLHKDTQLVRGSWNPSLAFVLYDEGKSKTLTNIQLPVRSSGPLDPLP